MITYLVVGIIWLVMINIASLLESRINGISECEKSCKKDGISLKEMSTKMLLLGCLFHIIAWPITIPYYIWEVYLKK